MIKSYIDELKEGGFSTEDIKEIVMATVRVDVSPFRAIQDELFLLRDIQKIKAESLSLREGL